MPLATAAAPALGAALLGLVAYEAYATILLARGRSGPIAEALNRAAWRGALALAFRLPRGRRHRLLGAVGPLLLPAQLGALVALLIVGYALLYWPSMPGGFVVDGASADGPVWLQALYFSGATLTTLGYGDIAPRTPGLRLLAVSQAALGFVSISLAAAYLLAVTAALERRRAAALSFYHQAGRGADAAGLVARHFVNGRFLGLEAALGQAAHELQRLLEAHVEHPVIHYFHAGEVHKGMPRMLFLALEVCAVLRACLERSAHPDLLAHPDVRELEETARHVLRRLAASLGLRGGADGDGGHADEAAPGEGGSGGAPAGAAAGLWCARHAATLRRLAEVGVAVRADAAGEGLRDYARSRLAWEGELRAFAARLGYDWEEVAGDRDLRVAEEGEEEGEASPLHEM